MKETDAASKDLCLRFGSKNIAKVWNLKEIKLN